MTLFKQSKTIALVTLFLFLSPMFSEESKTQSDVFWEIGAGLSTIQVPHYAGSDQNEIYAIPFPFVVYESERFSLNREGLKQHVINTSGWDFDISFAGTLPVDSSKNEAREGMPDLDWVSQAGPSLVYTFWRSDSDVLKFVFPVHFSLATDFSDIEYIGWEASPTFRYEKEFYTGRARWKTIFSASQYYASNDYNDYIYSVDEDYETIDRPAYDAKKGSSGYQAMLGLTYRKDNFWLGTFLRHRSLDGAVFEDSPLVKRKENLYLGVAFSWIVKSSNP